MADLTDLLGTAYSRQPAARTVPEWSDDDHLDRAFASWEPGPGPEASATEREMFVSAARSVDPTADVAPSIESAPDGAELTAATAETQPGDSPEDADIEALPADIPRWTDEVSEPPAPFLTSAPERPAPAWRREDEDVLPGRVRLALRLPSFRR